MIHSTQTGRSRHPYVLIVDDDADTRELYNVMLSGVGCRIDTVGSVTGVVERLATQPPDVVVTDWRLPDGDGFDVANVLRRRPAARGVPLVAVTGISMSAEMAADANAHGFTSVLLKPAAPEDILRAVRSANITGNARRLRAASQRLRRYAALASLRSRQSGSPPIIDTSVLAAKAAARSGADITLMVADDAAHYVAVAGSTRELTGYEPQELLELSVWDLTPAVSVPSGQGQWSEFIAAGRQEGCYLLRRRDGRPVEAQFCAIANIIPGLHVSAIAPANQIPASF